MMEIKFRYWDEDLEKMFYVGRGGLGSLCWDLDSCGVDTYNSDESIISMQYVGLKDKNGKDIYEGDIISFWNGTLQECADGDIVIKDKKYKRHPNILRKIVYRAPSFCVDGGNPLGSAYLSQGDIEVVGNIYENPELLGEID